MRGRRARTDEIGPSSSSTPRRVLVKEVNWLGDLVLSLPALRTLRAALADTRISVLVRRELAGFFDGMYWIDEVIPYTFRRGLRGLADQRKIIVGIRQRCFDLTVLFPNSFRSALWPMLAGVPRRVGYATGGRRLLLTDRALPPADVMKGAQGWYWLAMLEQTLGFSSATDGICHRLEVSERSIARMRDWLKSRRTRHDAALIAVAPAAAYGPAKEWPGSHYAALIDLLSIKTGAECVLVGGPAERTKCEQIAVAAQTPVMVAAGATDIAELKALLALCDGFVGNDSGAMHLAAALGKPAVGIFGSTNPARTGPVGPKSGTIYHHLECSPCLQRTCRFGHYQCLRSITPDEVAAKLAALGAFPPTS